MKKQKKTYSQKTELEVILTDYEKVNLSREIEQIIDYLKKDLTEMKEKLENSALPILMYVCSGIDFLGGLKFGFNFSVGKRIVDIMREYLNYNKELSEHIYKYIRCSISHGIFIYGDFETSKTDFKECHLKRKIETVTEDGSARTITNTIFIHPENFIEDFFEALEKFYSETCEFSLFKDYILNNYYKEKKRNEHSAKNKANSLKLEYIRIENNNSKLLLGTSVQSLTTRFISK